MPKTDIMLLKYVDGLGSEGDLVQVAAGYARNYLMPRGLGLLASRTNRKQIEALKKARLEREKRDIEQAKALQTRLEKLHLAIAVRTGDQGKKLFGSVTAHSLIKRLNEEGIDLHAKQFHWGDSIKALGKYNVPVKLCSSLVYDLHFEVVSENPIEAEVVQQDQDSDHKPGKKDYKKKRKSFDA